MLKDLPSCLFVSKQKFINTCAKESHCAKRSHWLLVCFQEQIHELTKLPYAESDPWSIKVSTQDRQQLSKRFFMSLAI